MKRGAIVVGVAGLATFLLAGFASKPEDPAASIARYRSWTKANPEPANMSFAVVVMCQMPTAKQQMSAHSDSPHKDYYLTVYVNEVAKSGFLSKKNPKLPVGSVIVKEKLLSKDAKDPELLTAMIKREVGYDPEHGDWEYLVLNGSGARVFGRGKISSCQSCHDGQRSEGYFYRNYLPHSIAKDLK